MRAQGITVSSVSLGDGAAKEIMQMIAQEGGGRYYETNDPNNMPQIFTKETMQASAPRSKKTSSARSSPAIIPSSQVMKKPSFLSCSVTS